MKYPSNWTEKQRKASARNYYHAKRYFNLQKGYVLHHKDITLRTQNVERYVLWLPEDLIPMTKEEHTRLHNLGNTYRKPGTFHHTEETKKRLSASHKGKPTWMKGKHHTEEAKQKCGNATKGKHRIYREDGSYYYG